ncbi:MAG: tetratricopeptide repeat protein [Bacteroidales bacterium]|nr:tetratricopeptide repeat protein [Bacteroidales bacterium]
MQESYDHYFEEESLYQAISRFEDMIKSNTILYFDICEFEIIIDYYLDLHNYRVAEEAVQLGLSQHPNSTEIKFRLAEIYVQAGKPAKGLRLLKEIENVEAVSSEFYLLKGSALNLLGRKEETSAAFDLAINYSIENKDETIYNIALSYINTRRYKLAIKYLNLAHEVNPYNLAVIHEMALMCERIDDLNKSVEFYKKYLDIDPFNDNVWLSLGMVYSNLDNSEKAIDAYDFAIAIDPRNITALFSKANTLVNMGNNKEAIAAYIEILEIEPDNAQAYTYIGECYEKLEFYKRSVYYFNRAIEIDENFSDAWYGLGLAYFHQDLFAESQKYFAKANNLDPENSDYWFMLGEVHRKLGNLEKSAEAYNRVIELDPNDHEAWLCRAELSFKDNNDIKGAIRILSKAFEYNPDASVINYQLSVYYFINSQNKLALRHFEKGLSVNFYEHLEFFPEIPNKSVKTLSTLISRYKNLSNLGL